MMVRQEREIMEKMDVMDLQEEMEVAEMEVGGGVPLPGFRAMGEMEIQEALAELEVEGVQEGVKIAELDPHASFVGPVEVEVAKQPNLDKTSSWSDPGAASTKAQKHARTKPCTEAQHARKYASTSTKARAHKSGNTENMHRRTH